MYPKNERFFYKNPKFSLPFLREEFLEKINEYQKWGVIGLVVLQFVLLIILSRKLGIEYFTDILDKYGYNHPFVPIKKPEKTKE
jgi:hypothetical protein